MAKPNDYRETHTLTADVPYRGANKTAGGTQASEGVLRQGRVVWSQANQQKVDSSASVTVYAEGLGLIDLPAAVLSNDRLTSLRR